MTNMSVDQDKIAKAIQEGNYDRFKEIIDSDAILNADKVLFQICSEKSLEEDKRCTFAESLLNKYNAHGKNTSIDLYQSYPLHMAAERGLNKLLSTLLTHPNNPADKDVLTSLGETAIYSAVYGAASRKSSGSFQKMDDDFQCVKLLTDHGCDLFARSNQGCKFTPVHLAAQHKMWQIVFHFLERHANIDLEINKTTARKLIRKFDSRWVMDDYIGYENSGDDDRKPLFDILENRKRSVSNEDKEKEFAAFLENNPKFNLRINDIYKGKYTLLECAVKNGLRRAAKTLLNCNKDPANPNQALFAALEQGEEFFEILQKSKIQIDVSKKVNGANYTLLHKVVLSPNPSAKVIKSILQMGEEKFGNGFAQWVNSQDYRGCTALHYAAKRHLVDEVQALLQSSANIFIPDFMEVPALNYIQPEVVEAYFDDKIKMTDSLVIDDCYGVTFDYNFMDTSKFIQTKQPKYTSKNLLPSQFVKSLYKRIASALVRTDASAAGNASPAASAPAHNCTGASATLLGYTDASGPALNGKDDSATALDCTDVEVPAPCCADSNLLKDTTIVQFVGNKEKCKDKNSPEEKKYIQEIGPLKLLASSPRHKHLVMHPIVTNFLHLKWRRLYWLYWLNFLFYLVFMVFLTLFLFTLDFVNTSGSDDVSKNLTNESEIKIKVKMEDLIPEVAYDAVIKFGTFILTVILIARELFQFMFLWGKYFTQLENYLEMFIVGATVWLLTSPNHVILSAFLYLLASLEFVLLMGKLPRMATNIKMFTTVSINFIKFFLFYLVLIFAFAVSFFMILNKCKGNCDKNFFETLPKSIFKTVIMISGEYEAGEINFDHVSIASHFIFIAFLFLISIVMVNLLNGLAVSDTQKIRNMAELKFYKTQIEFFADVESYCSSLKKLGAPFSMCRSSLILNCLPPNKKMMVYLNQDYITEPDMSLWGERNGCFCFTVRKYPRFIKNAFEVYNKIVEKAVQVANASNAVQVKMDQIILKRLARLEKLIETKHQEKIAPEV